MSKTFFAWIGSLVSTAIVFIIGIAALIEAAYNDKIFWSAIYWLLALFAFMITPSCWIWLNYEEDLDE